jgi:hypothetical protein
MGEVSWTIDAGLAAANCDGKTLWTGAVDRGATVSVRPAVHGSDDAIVLLNPEQRPEGVEPWHPFFNLLRLTPSGDVRWRAELVPSETAAKCFYGVEWRDDGSLRALAWSYDCTIDSETGRLFHAEFTK